MTHHSAYSAGRQAYFAGRDIETNPWIYTDNEAALQMRGKWQAGWFDAQEETVRKGIIEVVKTGKPVKVGKSIEII